MNNTLIKIPPVLRVRGFAYYWSGTFLSFLSAQMMMAAMLWHLRSLSDLPVVVSGIGLARFLPILLLAPLGGVIADSFNRRKVLFVTQTTMALSTLALGLLTASGHIQVWHIYVLGAIQSAANGFDTPARQALVPNLVKREDLPNAFSLTIIAVNVGAVMGPGLSGMAIGYLGQAAAYWINGFTFLAVLIPILLIGPVPQQTTPPGQGLKASLESIREGASFTFRQPILLSSMLLDFIATFFSSANTLLPFVARDILGVNEVAYGWLVASESLGAVLVGTVMSQRTNFRRQGLLLFGAVIMFGIATILFGLAASFFAAMVALMLVGASDGVSTILRNTIRQLHTPDQLRGRMLSINQIFFMGGPQLGNIEAGLVAQAFGIPAAIISGGIGCILGAVWVATRWPALRRYDGHEALKPSTT